MTLERDADPTYAEHDLFEGGPPRRLTALARLPAPICPNVATRVILVILLGWLPLPVLIIFAETTASEGALRIFAGDVGTHARYAIAAPLLVLGWQFCARRLGSVAVHFLRSGLLDEEGEQRFLEILRNARKWVNSLWVEAITLALIYAIIVTLLSVPLPEVLLGWHLARGGVTLSPAGWWHMLVSVPLLLLLLFGWIWRIVIWTITLHRISRLELRLIAAHPDQAAGLGFLCQSVRAFSIVGMALGTIAAGRFAQVHLHGHPTPFSDGMLAAGVALLAVVLFVGPLAVFSWRLARVWRIGAMTYGALATELGTQFERAWLSDPQAERRKMLSEPDFSAATDLYQVVGNVYAMRFVPIDVRSMVILLGATLAPFIPAMLLSMPITTVLEELRGLLF